jgi:hypothetical protein
MEIKEVLMNDILQDVSALVSISLFVLTLVMWAGAV